MKRFRPPSIAFVCGLASFAAATAALPETAQAVTTTLTSNTPELGGGIVTPGTPLPIASFNFSAASTLGTLDSLTLNLGLIDGDSVLGAFDNGNIFITLDGISLGPVNTLPNNNSLTNFSINLTSAASAPLLNAILAAVRSDNQLVAGILDTDFDAPANGDTFLGFPTGFNFITAPASSIASLSLTGQAATVPFEFSPGLGVAVCAGALGVARVRRRLQKA